MTMKTNLWLLLFLAIFLGCSKVPSGHVGIKVYLLGSSKGVDYEVLGVGKYWIGVNEEIFLFPTFQQNYTWTASKEEGKATDESISFQTKEGLEVNTDIGITYHLEQGKISNIFQKYRKGVEEITDVYLRNYVRDALNSVASKSSVEEVYGEGKQRLITEVKNMIKAQVGPEGIVIDNLYLIGSFRLPKAVVSALNAKIEATQKAVQRENEVREAEAMAKKEIAIAQGVAEANRIKQESITEQLIRWETVQKWNGQLPQVTSGALPFINIDAKK